MLQIHLNLLAKVLASRPASHFLGPVILQARDMVSITKPQPTHRSGATLVLLFIATGTRLLKGLKAKRTTALDDIHTHASAYYPSYSGLAGLANESETMLLGMEINGYWKEVRASLGLPTLPDTIVVPAIVNTTSTGGTTGSQSYLSVEDEGYLRRLGRINPRLWRRRLMFQVHPPTTSSSSLSREHSQKEQGQGQNKLLLDNTHTGAVSNLLLTNQDGTRQAPSFQDSFPSSGAEFAELFISPDVFNTTRRTSVSEIAASFRAIAIKGLRRPGRFPYLRHGKHTIR
ncbi:uncharacterized protein FOMMEDRAFT_166366 [Fomitiporia mediterranea MF3/22]|uniref:uncharacterized protein n=1 Tax=Fomitiporia mediterranea (strain MF3/22) TaxID=694068 RepID=UPI00044090DC|nr:uncharacterized protein FOMMEDRAFT_166366 [Fomitiporia mediterranea MF3/22]EJD06083.1 hypothetical protein FOMMEDRAFT_166366 [Fomitiporia mediterranea MF3/22]